MFAIWLPMLPGDSRSAWDSHVLDDARVTEFWDGSRIVGNWFGKQQIGGLGGQGSIVWDAYYAFPKNSMWSPQQLTGVLAAGSDIIDNVSGLERDFIPLLKG